MTVEDPPELKPLPDQPEVPPPRVSGEGEEIVELESVAGPPPVAVPGLVEMPDAKPGLFVPAAVPGFGEMSEAETAAGRWKASAAEPLNSDDEEAEAEKETVGFARKTEDAEMDMTPMVDIVFQLLIFFMVTASFSLQKAKEIPKPKEDRPSTTAAPSDDPESDSEAVVVNVDENGTFLVTNADGDEEEAPSEQELLIKLRRAKDSGGGNVNRLIIKASGEAFHERVVIALDVGTAVGMERIILQTVDDEGK